jgi:uncharacterized protein (DUF169 family)
MERKLWQDYALALKEALNLGLSPVALSCLKEPVLGLPDKRLRICRAILDAASGQTLQISKDNNACFGASWHLGFNKINDPKIAGMIKKFVVEGEKLFSSYQALDNLVSQMGDIPDNSKTYFLLGPMEKTEFNPDLVIFVCNAEDACRILTLAVFIDGLMPKIKIGGPTCRMSIISPLLTGELNISFYDYTARKMCNVEKDKLLISLPYNKISKIVESIDSCSGGKAKIEYPEEFRAFLKSALTR